MAASDYVLIFFRNRLHLVGRPQMNTRPSLLLGPNRTLRLPTSAFDPIAEGDFRVASNN